MNIEDLKKEYELKYRIMRYYKLYRRYLCSTIEKNNTIILNQVLEDMKAESDLDKLNFL